MTARPVVYAVFEPEILIRRIGRRAAPLHLRPAGCSGRAVVRKVKGTTK